MLLSVVAYNYQSMCVFVCVRAPDGPTRKNKAVSGKNRVLQAEIRNDPLESLFLLPAGEDLGRKCELWEEEKKYWSERKQKHPLLHAELMCIGTQVFPSLHLFVPAVLSQWRDRERSTAAGVGIMFL